MAFLARKAPLEPSSARADRLRSSYGPDGERLKKTTSSGTTLHIGDAERDPAGAWTTYPAPELKRAGSALNWLHRDHLSSVRRITDPAGAITRSSVYQPYGTQVETVLAALSPSEPKGWIGERTEIWPMFPHDHECYIRNQIVMSGDLRHPFDPHRVIDAINPRIGELNEDGVRISEWTVAMDDARGFLEVLNTRP